MKACGAAGREYVLNPEFGFTATEMCKRFVHDIEQTFDNFKPRPRIMLDEASCWEHSKPEWNGLTLTKEI